MSEHFEAVEADFQSHYGLDLREVLWGSRPMGVRRILSLVAGLPLKGAVFRATVVHGHDWGTTEEMLATLIEVTDLTNRILYSANASKGTRVWEPMRVPRPTDVPEAPKMAEIADLQEAFGDNIVYAGGD